MFWESMMMTMGCGILIGMALHNGDVKGAWKSVISMAPLVILTAMVSYLRVYPHIKVGIESVKTYAGFFTVVFVALAYVLGFFLGVSMLHRVHRKIHL